MKSSEECADTHSVEDLLRFTTPPNSTPTRRCHHHVLGCKCQGPKSFVLMREEEASHLSIYYISNVFKWAELRYSRIETVEYIVVMAARRIRLFPSPLNLYLDGLVPRETLEVEQILMDAQLGSPKPWGI